MDVKIWNSFLSNPCSGKIGAPFYLVFPFWPSFSTVAVRPEPPVVWSQEYTSELGKVFIDIKIYLCNYICLSHVLVALLVLLKENMWQCDTSHVTCHNMKRQMSHVTCLMSHVSCHMSHATCVAGVRPLSPPSSKSPWSGGTSWGWTDPHCGRHGPSSCQPENEKLDLLLSLLNISSLFNFLVFFSLRRLPGYRPIFVKKIKCNKSSYVLDLIAWFNSMI